MSPNKLAQKVTILALKYEMKIFTLQPSKLQKNFLIILRKIYNKILLKRLTNIINTSMTGIFEKLKLAKPNEISKINYYNHIKNVKDHARRWLTDLSKNGIEHSISVEQNLDQIIKESKIKFGPQESFIILYVIYLHDIGYSIDKDSHAEISYNLIMSNKEKYFIDDNLLAEAIATICRYHHAKDGIKVLTEDELPTDYVIPYLRKFTGFDLKFLCALLRIADELDTDYLRVYNRMGQDNSYRHCVNYIKIGPENIVLKVNPKSEEQYKDLTNSVSKIRWILNDAKDILSIHNIKLSKVFTDPEKFESNKNNSLGNFKIETDNKLADFTGRKWLKEELFANLKTHGTRCCLITGEPGAGKSAFLSQLISILSKENDDKICIAAYHFCTSNMSDTIDPMKFVNSIADQLCKNITNYSNSLQKITSNKYKDTAHSYFKFIIDLLRKQNLTNQYLIVVDALDESEYYEGREDNIATLLQNEFSVNSTSPEFIKLVISSRKESRITDVFRNKLGIEANSDENKNDIHDYIEQKLKQEEVKKIIENKVEPEFVAREIEKNCEGNFLYVTSVINQIIRHELDPKEPTEYPKGLDDFFNKTFSKIFESIDYRPYKTILSLIIVAGEPLSNTLIYYFLDKFEFKNESEKFFFESCFEEYDELCIKKTMRCLADFFPMNDLGGYTPYHKYIQDWLIRGNDNNTKDITYTINPQRGHRIIGKYLFGRYLNYFSEPLDSVCYAKENDKINKFVIRHLPTHLRHGAKMEELKTVLVDINFINAKCRETWAKELLEDYIRAGVPKHSGPPILTARHDKGSYGVFCPLCCKWFDIEKNSLGMSLKCKKCENEIIINQFTVESNWG
jgi:nucleoside-triphosphatase THEP1